MLPSDYMHVLRQPHHEQLYSKYYVWFPWEINCIQQLIGDCGLEFTLITEITPIMSSSSWPPCPSWKKKITKTFLPHTKLSGGTEKMLWPLSASGWAQVAVTKTCSILPSSHGGSHLSWQSHRRLSLLIWLKGTKGHLRGGHREEGSFLSTQNGQSPLISSSASAGWNGKRVFLQLPSSGSSSPYTALEI